MFLRDVKLWTKGKPARIRGPESLDRKKERAKQCFGCGRFGCVALDDRASPPGLLFPSASLIKTLLVFSVGMESHFSGAQDRLMVMSVQKESLLLRF